MNINHEYWHLRENDPRAPAGASSGAASRVDIKFSFGNCLDDANEVKAAPPYGYVPEIAFGNLKWMERLRDSRFAALAGWHKDYQQIFDVMNDVTRQLFAQFQVNGATAQPHNNGEYGKNDLGFGWGTVHHSAGTLRMPYKPALSSPFEPNSVVDEDLQVIGTRNLYVCDMSVMPFSSAANPVRTLAALALRLSGHLN